MAHRDDRFSRPHCCWPIFPRLLRGVVECALRLLVQTHGQAGVRRLRGRVTWRGDLHQSRLERRDTGR